MSTVYTADLSHKKGDSFVGTFTSMDADGLPDTAPPSAFTSKFKTKNGQELSTATIAAGTDPGTYTYTVLNTDNWPVGYVYFDIKRVYGGLTSHTKTAIVQVVQTIT